MYKEKVNLEETEYNPHRIVTCCLCGRKLEWWQSNNPWPLYDDEESRCCSDCNQHQVLPARFQLLRANHE